MQRKRLIYLVAIVALLIAAIPAAVIANSPAAAPNASPLQQGETPDTLVEQAKALEAEQSAPAPDAATAFSIPGGGSYPLFMGVDDATVPAYQMDVTNSATIQAFVGAQVWGSAYDPVSDKVYFNNGSTLYEWPVGGTINALGTIVDPTGATQSMVGLAFYNGTLYGVKNIANEAVYTIDTTTLVATVYIDYIDADFDYGGLAADPNDGTLYATNDDTTPNGSGLFRINLDGTGTLITPYPAGQTDIDGLAVSDDGFAYLVIDEPGFIYVWDFAAGAYAAPLTNPWTSAEVFSGGAYIVQPIGAAISLNKTVGTDPNACAVTDEITVAAGTDVTYCYEVTNTGDVTLDFHDLDDSELGNIFSGLNYALTPGASVFVTQTTTINVTTVNTGTWSAYNQGPIDLVTASDMATVTVESQAPAIVLTKTVGLDPNVCATTDDITVPANTDVTYCYEVENTGSVTLNLHDLDDSELGNIFTDLAYTLTPGASVFVTQTTPIAVTTVNTGTWTAYNGGAVEVCSTPNVAIPDNNPTGVSDTLDSTTSGLISDLDVYINTTHTWVGDLIYTLQHVDTGTTVTLIDRPGYTGTGFGCSGDNIDNTVDDEAALSFENNCTPATNPAYIPGEHYQGGDPASSTLMTAFDGEDLSGDWTMTVSDNAGGDTGTLNEWCLVTSGDPVSVQASDVATVTVQGDPPNIFVDPLSMASTQATNTQVQQTLTISNTGGGTLDWIIDEEDTTAACRSIADPAELLAKQQANGVAPAGGPIEGHSGCRRRLLTLRAGRTPAPMRCCGIRRTTSEPMASPPSNLAATSGTVRWRAPMTS